MLELAKSGATPADRYLDLLKAVLTRTVLGEGTGYFPVTGVGSPLKWRMLAPARRISARFGVEVVRRKQVDLRARMVGRDWPGDADTMIGMRRLDHLQQCVEDILRRNVPGDLCETGVWRGGASILMRAVLAAYEDKTRTVWAADSFEGLPTPDATRYPADAGDTLSKVAYLSASLEEVRDNFARYGLLDRQVVFLKGWFKDTLPGAPIAQLALLRLDGDMYESTMDALTALYPKLSIGGYCIVDDYGNIAACREAVHDYRDRRGIDEPIGDIDGWGAFWQRRR